MGRRVVTCAASLVTLAVLASCAAAGGAQPLGGANQSPDQSASPGGSAPTSPGPGSGTGEPSAKPSNGANVIDFNGLPDIPIGLSVNMLTDGGFVDLEGPGCGPLFTSIPYASPVIYQEQLVLIWAYPPLHTPEGIMVGSTLAQARQAYPGAIELTGSAEPGQYRGLLVHGPPDRAYLLLHDGTHIQKLVVGIEQYARLVLTTGFGTC